MPLSLEPNTPAMSQVALLERAAQRAQALADQLDQDIGRVAEQQSDALFAHFTEAFGVKVLALRGIRVDLEVTAVDDAPRRGVDDEPA